jgi:hypothetical protein
MKEIGFVKNTTHMYVYYIGLSSDPNKIYLSVYQYTVQLVIIYLRVNKSAKRLLKNS